jgi:hypothetical protein
VVIGGVALGSLLYWHLKKIRLVVSQNAHNTRGDSSISRNGKHANFGR